MDYSYFSVRPCRPDNGVPSECCLFNLAMDPGEDNPLITDCAALMENGTNLFTVEGGCDDLVMDKNGITRPSNPLCLNRTFSQQTNVHTARELEMWSQYGASGPFLNKDAVSVSAGIKDGIGMKCVCQATDDISKFKQADYFTLTSYATTQCFNSHDTVPDPAFAAVPCDGSQLALLELR